MVCDYRGAGQLDSSAPSVPTSLRWDNSRSDLSKVKKPNSRISVVLSLVYGIIPQFLKFFAEALTLLPLIRDFYRVDYTYGL